MESLDCILNVNTQSKKSIPSSLLSKLEIHHFQDLTIKKIADTSKFDSLGISQQRKVLLQQIAQLTSDKYYTFGISLMNLNFKKDSKYLEKFINSQITVCAQNCSEKLTVNSKCNLLKKSFIANDDYLLSSADNTMAENMSVCESLTNKNSCFDIERGQFANTLFKGTLQKYEMVSGNQDKFDINEMMLLFFGKEKQTYKKSGFWILNAIVSNHFHRLKEEISLFHSNVKILNISIKNVHHIRHYGVNLFILNDKGQPVDEVFNNQSSIKENLNNFDNKVNKYLHIENTHKVDSPGSDSQQSHMLKESPISSDLNSSKLVSKNISVGTINKDNQIVCFQDSKAFSNENSTICGESSTAFHAKSSSVCKNSKVESNVKLSQKRPLTRENSNNITAEEINKDQLSKVLNVNDGKETTASPKKKIIKLNKTNFPCSLNQTPQSNAELNTLKSSIEPVGKLTDNHLMNSGISLKSTSSTHKENSINTNIHKNTTDKDMLPENSSSESSSSENIESYYKQPFKSTDEKENKDINDTRWDLMRKLKTDEERYVTVRKLWKNVDVPDPNQNLTFHAFRRRHFYIQPNCPGNNKVNITKRRREQTPDLNYGEPSSKRCRRFNSLSFHNKFIDVTMSNVYHDYLDALDRLPRFGGQSRKYFVQKRYEEYCRQLHNCRKEAEVIHKFYTGLPNQSFHSQREIEGEQDDLEQIFDLFKIYYSWSGIVFNPI